MFLQVSEIFGPTIQGEGKSAGKEVLFLRLAVCNLHCIWCDSKYTWDWKNYDKKKEVYKKSFEEVYEILASKNLKSLVITGGEPLLQHKVLSEFLNLLKDYWVEIETNGTLYSEEVFSKVNQINCSPKLSNSGDRKDVRLRKSLYQIAKLDKATFKFVVSREQDIAEIEKIIQEYKLKPENVFLMPLGLSREELALTREMTISLAEKMGLQFSDRLHIVKWGTKRGV